MTAIVSCGLCSMTLGIGCKALAGWRFLNPHFGQVITMLDLPSFAFLGRSLVPHLGQNSIE